MPGRIVPGGGGRRPLRGALVRGRARGTEAARAQGAHVGGRLHGDGRGRNAPLCRGAEGPAPEDMELDQDGLGQGRSPPARGRAGAGSPPRAPVRRAPRIPGTLARRKSSVSQLPGLSDGAGKPDLPPLQADTAQSGDVNPFSRTVAIVNFRPSGRAWPRILPEADTRGLSAISCGCRPPL